MFEKTPYFSDGKGNRTPRSKGQDKIPKVFPHRPEFMIWMFETPTERRLLWMIAHYPYIFNVFFLSDTNRNFNKQAIPAHTTPLARALLVCHSLKMKGYIKQSKDNQKWHLTPKGKVFRFTSHPAYPLFQVGFPVVIAATVAITIYKLNRINTLEDRAAEKGKEKVQQPNYLPPDSVQYNSSQIVPLKAKDSFLIDSGKTKTLTPN